MKFTPMRSIEVMKKSMSSTGNGRQKMRSNIAQYPESRTSPFASDKKILGNLTPIVLRSDSLLSSSSKDSRTKDSSNELITPKSSVFSGSDPVPSYNQLQSINLVSSDVVQSSANLVYPNVKRISTGYFFNQSIEIEKNSLYTFQNTLNRTKNMPLVFVGSEYFLRKPIRPERLTFPLSNRDDIEPLIDLFLSRPQFIKEVPDLNDLSPFRTLPQSIVGSIFFDSPSTQAGRHLCHEWRTKENRNHFNITDLLRMSQRENHIIQSNALNDIRFYALKKELTTVFDYDTSLSFNKEHHRTYLPLGLPEIFTRSVSPMSRRSMQKNLRTKLHATHIH